MVRFCLPPQLDQAPAVVRFSISTATSDAEVLSNGYFEMMKNLKFVATISVASTLIMVNHSAVSLDTSPEPLHQVSQQGLSDLYESEFSIWRIEGDQKRDHQSTEAPWAETHRPVGMGFVIREQPLILLTCYHVVSEGTESNNGDVTYAIARRPGDANEVDLRKAQLTFLRIKRLSFKPEFDLAVLEIDTAMNSEDTTKFSSTISPEAKALGQVKARAIDLDFSRDQRTVGTAVMWSTTAAQTGSGTDSELPLRFFFGNIVANYITNEAYSFKSASGVSTHQTMPGVQMFEVDKLFIPGASGSPIVNAATNKAIGYVHGYRAFNIPSSIRVTEDIQLIPGLWKTKMNRELLMAGTLSIGVDLRTVESYLKEQGYISK